MLGVYISQNFTEVLKADKKKSDLKIVGNANFIGDYLTPLLNCDHDQVKELLSDIKSQFKDNDGFYIVLPDYAFNLVDCCDVSSNMLNDVLATANVQFSDIVYCIPYEMKHPVAHKKTVCVLYKNVIDTLMQVASELNIIIASVEAASVAFMRTVSTWDEEFMLLNVGKTSSSITVFSPITGLFSYNITENIYPGNSNIEKEIDNLIIKVESISSKTFGLFGIDSPVYLVSGENSYKQYVVCLKNRFKRLSCLPINDSPVPLEKIIFCYGTLLSVLDPSYNNKDKSLIVMSGNILPDEVKHENHQIFMYRMIKKYLFGFVGLLSVFLLVQFAAILYFNNSEVPADLKSRYSKSQKELVVLNREIGLIDRAKIEESYSLKALSALLTKRPPALGFTDIDIGSYQNTAVFDKKRVEENDRKWIQISVQTTDPMLIQEYISLLAENPLFKSVTVNSIGSNSNARIKNAKINIAKGTVK